MFSAKCVRKAAKNGEFATNKLCKESEARMAVLTAEDIVVMTPYIEVYTDKGVTVLEYTETDLNIFKFKVIIWEGPVGF